MGVDCWVIMGNDYPAAVLASETAANDYILMRKWEHLVQPDHTRTHIHWRSYKFEMDSQYTPETMRLGKDKASRNMTTEELLHEWFYWYHKQAEQGPATLSFLNQVQKELYRRNIHITRLVENYHSLVAVERARARLLDDPKPRRPTC